MIEFNQYILGFGCQECVESVGLHSYLFFYNYTGPKILDSLVEYQLQKTSDILKRKPKIYNILNN